MASGSIRSAPGPYKFVSHKPGLEVELEAYARRIGAACPNVKTLIMKSVPESTTRAVMVKTGEADIASALDGPEAEEMPARPAPAGGGVQASRRSSGSSFTEQWDRQVTMGAT